MAAAGQRGGFVTTYAVNKFCWRVVHEQPLRLALHADPEATLRAVVPPLDEEELQALLRGDVGWLSRRGCNNFMLHNLGRFEVLGLDLATHGARMREEYRAEREIWKQTGDWPDATAPGVARGAAT
ncbi:MAG: hypothetical protein QOJ62_670 [Actinomycetota bacterium]|jgi:hypothetical protein|nr:hypothetical protein [Actinomycetota bacterium]